MYFEDSNFLLRFLRVKKYSVPMAQEAIERYLLLRKTDYGHMFQNVDMKIPNINALLDLG